MHTNIASRAKQTHPLPYGEFRRAVLSAFVDDKPKSSDAVYRHVVALHPKVEKYMVQRQLSAIAALGDIRNMGTKKHAMYALVKHIPVRDGVVEHRLS